MNRIRILLLNLLVAMIPVFADAQHVYTLDECLEMAMQNNVRIKNADNDVAAAEQQQKSAFTNYFPTVSASGIGFMADKGLLQLEMMPGMELSLLKNGVAGGVTASLPLFTGGQIVHGNRLAKVNVEASRLRRRMSADEVRLTVERYFWQVVMLKEKLRTISTVQEQLRQIYQDVETAVKAGVTNRNDLLQVGLRRNEMRSKGISVENALQVSRSLLAQYIGATADSIDVDLHMDGGLPVLPDTLYQLPETSLGQLAEYHLLEKNVEANRLQYKVSVGKNLPTVAVGGGYMYDNLMDKDHPFWIGGVTVSIPLTKWWGGQRREPTERPERASADTDAKRMERLDGCPQTGGNCH